MPDQIKESMRYKESQENLKESIEESMESAILDDLKKGTPWNKITQKYHVSSKTISKIRSEHQSQQSSVSDGDVSAKAFELFELGKDPVEATIELKQPPQMISEIYDLWMRMREKSKKINDELSKKLEERFNEGRKVGHQEGYRRGYDYAMKVEHFRVPCSICGKPMHFMSTDREWQEKIKPKFLQTFATWCHAECGGQ